MPNGFILHSRTVTRSLWRKDLHGILKVRPRRHRVSHCCRCAVEHVERERIWEGILGWWRQVWGISWISSRVFICFFPALRFVVYSLKKKLMMHHTVRLLCLSVIFEFLSVFFGFIYQLDYASRGEKAVWVDVVFRLMHAASDIFLLLLLIVIVKGWSVVRRKISAKGRVKIGVFCTAYSYTHYWLSWHITEKQRNIPKNMFISIPVIGAHTWSSSGGWH